MAARVCIKKYEPSLNFEFVHWCTLRVRANVETREPKVCGCQGRMISVPHLTLAGSHLEGEVKIIRGYPAKLGWNYPGG